MDRSTLPWSACPLIFDITWLAEARYPEIAKDFLQDMLCAVSYCHSHGVLHPDLKPENILVDLTNKRLKLADFGTARGFLNADKMLTLTSEVTTLVYRAPELLQNLGMYSTASDVWALGCIFAEMLMKGGGEKVLFEGDNQMAVLSEIKRAFFSLIQRRGFQLMLL